MAEDGGIGLVAVEEVVAAQVSSQRAQAAERDVFLDAEVANDAGPGDAEVVVLSFLPLLTAIPALLASIL